ncbi:MarR family winged helix-turn-helix transcriptional regulator [Sutterella sp.]|uniref:MarR family winged helix-turn-helix transcriptional regulator n=1 Tax=Sutterella sp. TaxID=1981025 RepID=UPI0026DFBDE9|nr:MarR family transcriptional regulator [Sutterella sp.]MDO5530909.1 MarR family transcriptional regulator [Sutterella sp.]
MKQRPILALAARLHEEGHRRLLASLKSAGLADLTTSCGDIFMVLFQKEGQSLTAVAEKIHRTKSTTSIMIDRLVKQGYIEKRVSPKDARATVICLTDKGRGLKPVMDEISMELTESLCNGLTDEEADQLERLLAKAVFGMKTAEKTVFVSPRRGGGEKE